MLLLEDWVVRIRRVEGAKERAEEYSKCLRWWTSIDLWLEYLEFLIKENYPVQQLRDEFEQAISKVGISFDGNTIWDLYIKFESEHGNNESAQNIVKRCSKIINCKNHGQDKQEREEYEFLVSRESLLQDLNDHIRYIQDEQARKHPNNPRIRYLFERALCLYSDNETLWRLYLEFSKDHIGAVWNYQRAVTIFRLDIEIWLGYLRALEKSPLPFEEIQEIVQTPLEIFEGDDKLWVALAWLGMTRRLFPDRVVEEAWELDIPDESARIEQFIIDSQSARGSIKDAFRTWERAIKTRSKSSYMWFQYIAFAQRYSDHETVCELYIRACSSVSDPNAIFAAWIEYENRFGSLDNLEFAELRVKKQQALLLQRASAPVAHGTHLQALGQIHGEKRSIDDEEAIYMEAEDSKRLKLDELTLYLSNLDYQLTVKKLKAFLTQLGLMTKEIRMPKDREKGHNRGFAYCVFEDLDSYSSALRSDKVRLDGRPVYIGKVNEKFKPKFTTDRDPRTLYVSHIPHFTKHSELQELFEKCEGLTEIRMVVAKTGRSRGCAYVEFDSEENARNALQMDGTFISHQRISVVISDPSVNSIVDALANTNNSNEKAHLEQNKKQILVPRQVKKKI